MKRARFHSPENEEFYRVLRKEVNGYFKKEGIKKTGNFSLYFKTVFLFALLLVPFSTFFIIPNMSAIAFVVMWSLMGFAMAGIGLSVMHDSVHGVYSSNRSINDFVSHFSMFTVGGFVSNWRIQHNQLHHTYTNVKDLDEDINPPFGLLRLSPEYPLQNKHRFQHIYAWFLYTLMTVMWTTTKDIRQIVRFRKAGFYDNKDREYRNEWIRLILFKVGYFFIFVGLPFLFSPYSFGLMLLGILLMNMISGFVLAIVFQPAHVTPKSEFPLVESDSIIRNSWAGHQMITTQNFANSSRLFTWYVGGLNYQIEHHLFPNVSHVHYPAIAPMVKRIAKDYNLPYNHCDTFGAALVEHGKMLYQLGHK
ncbi:MAG: fatty acid desaturase family protein [Salibacteraceae bacterium]